MLSRSYGREIDFLGVNYYMPWVVRETTNKAPIHAETVDIPQTEVTNMGWIVYPKGLYDVLHRLYDVYSVPSIYITENGAAYPDIVNLDGMINDEKRKEYIEQHILAVQYALGSNIPIQGYMAWSLLNNFEWALGYSKRFGIVYTDYRTQNRTIKQSGYRYKEIIQEHTQ